jgi:hypothetical protein
MEPRTSDRLHAAIQSGAWSTAQDLLTAFRQEVEASWRAAKTEQERQVIARETTGFLEWARAMTITSRAHAADSLNRLSRRHAYAGLSLENPHRGMDA